jgi:hypothetical protein
VGESRGCRSDFATPLGFGLYFDNFSRDLTVQDNVISGSTIVGLLFQNSSGTASGNLLYANSAPGSWGAALNIVGSVTRVTLAANVLFSESPRERTLALEGHSQLLASDANVFFSPYAAASIVDGGTPRTLASWRAASGFDGTSLEQWYSDPWESPRRSALFVNPGGAPLSVPLTGAWFDVRHQGAGATLQLAPFSGEVLLRDRVFADGFESGDAAAWSASQP